MCVYQGKSRVLIFRAMRKFVQPKLHQAKSGVISFLGKLGVQLPQASNHTTILTHRHHSDQTSRSAL